MVCIEDCFFFSSRRRHTRLTCDSSSDVCSSDLSTPSETSSTATTPPKRLVTCSSERRATAPYLKSVTVFAPSGVYSLGGVTLCVVGQSGDRHRRGAPLFVFGLKRTVPAARRAR